MPTTPDVIQLKPAYDAFLAVAMGIPADSVKPCRAEIQLVTHNAEKGAAELLKRKAELPVEVQPPMRWSDVEEIPQLCQALRFADAQLTTTVKEKQDTQERLRAVYKQREVLLTQATAAATLDLLPRETVEKILRGRGALDAVEDTINLVELFRNHAVGVKGKCAITDDMLKVAEENASVLYRVLKPASAKPPAKTPDEAARLADIRDRFWTLLNQRHDHIWRAAVWFWGEEAEDHVPPLQSRRIRRHGAAQA